MQHPELESYVPAGRYLEGKDALPGRECREDFALFAPARDGRIYAARGTRLRAGSRLELPAAERRFLEERLTSYNRIALLTAQGVAVCCAEPFPATGLLPVFLPQGEPAMLARCLGYLGRPDTVLSPAVARLSAESAAGRPEECYAMLEEQFAACGRILRPDSETGFRLHCALAARFAGCRADVLALPAGNLPLAPADRLRWIALLLCVFLTLRGGSAGGPVLGMGENDRRTLRLRLTHTRERRESPDRRPAPDFLSLPCFSGVSLRQSGQTWLLEFALPRAVGDFALRTPIPLPAPGAFLCLEIDIA